MDQMPRRRPDPTADVTFMFLCALLVLIVLLAVARWVDGRSADCEARGGVYLAREGKCVVGIEELP